MGLAGVPVYGFVDLGSAIETAEKLIKRIKKNRYTTEDIKNLHEVLSEIENAIANADKE